MTLHDNGKIAVSKDHKALFEGLQYQETGGYFTIVKPTPREQGTIMNRLFDFGEE